MSLSLVLFDVDGCTSIVETSRLGIDVRKGEHCTLLMSGKKYLVEILEIADSKDDLDSYERGWTYSDRGTVISMKKDLSDGKKGGYLNCGLSQNVCTLNPIVELVPVDAADCQETAGSVNCRKKSVKDQLQSKSSKKSAFKKPVTKAVQKVSDCVVKVVKRLRRRNSYDVQNSKPICRQSVILTKANKKKDVQKKSSEQKTGSCSVPAETLRSERGRSKTQLKRNGGSAGKVTAAKRPKLAQKSEDKTSKADGSAQLRTFPQKVGLGNRRLDILYEGDMETDAAIAEPRRPPNFSDHLTSDQSEYVEQQVNLFNEGKESRAVQTDPVIVYKDDGQLADFDKNKKYLEILDTVQKVYELLVQKTPEVTAKKPATSQTEQRIPTALPHLFSLATSSKLSRTESPPLSGIGSLQTPLQFSPITSETALPSLSQEQDPSSVISLSSSLQLLSKTSGTEFNHVTGTQSFPVFSPHFYPSITAGTHSLPVSAFSPAVAATQPLQLSARPPVPQFSTGNQPFPLSTTPRFSFTTGESQSLAVSTEQQSTSARAGTQSLPDSVLPQFSAETPGMQCFQMLTSQCPALENKPTLTSECQTPTPLIRHHVSTFQPWLSPARSLSSSTKCMPQAENLNSPFSCTFGSVSSPCQSQLSTINISDLYATDSQGIEPSEIPEFVAYPVGTCTSQRNPPSTCEQTSTPSRKPFSEISLNRPVVEISSHSDMAFVPEGSGVIIKRNVRCDLYAKYGHSQSLFGWQVARTVFTENELNGRNFNGRGRLPLSPRRKQAIIKTIEECYGDSRKDLKPFIDGINSGIRNLRRKRLANLLNQL